MGHRCTATMYCNEKRTARMKRGVSSNLVCDLRAPVAVWDVLVPGPLEAVFLRVPLQAQDGVLLGLNSADVHLLGHTAAQREGGGGYGTNTKMVAPCISSNPGKLLWATSHSTSQPYQHPPTDGPGTQCEGSLLVLLRGVLCTRSCKYRTAC